MQEGALIRYTLRIHGIPLHWKTEITVWDPPRLFVDVQISGPYKLWHHTHNFWPERGGTILGDRVLYALPLGPIGRIAHYSLVRHELKDIFDYRSDKMRELFGG